MRWGNKADKTLAVAAVLFVAALIFKLNNPASVLARGLSFCAEAALIGGVADWFAVTALFKKPLGFPYHTAILPRRREQFTLSCVRLVQEEFFSKKSIFQRIKSVNFLPMMLQWLDTAERKAALTGYILQYIEHMAGRLDLAQLAKNWEKDLKAFLRHLPQAAFYDGVGKWLIASGRDQAWLSRGIEAAREALAGEKGQARIQKLLEDFRQEKTRGNSLASLFSVLAEMSNIVNFSETAGILQRQVLQQLQDLSDEKNPARKELLAALHSSLANLLQQEEWQCFIENWREDLLEKISFQPAIVQCLEDLLQQLLRPQAPATGNAPVPAGPLRDIIEREINNGLALLQKDAAIQETIDHFLYDLVGRTALKAQLMVGDIAAAALQSMTDEQINALIYGKVEQDLLWIRMNGSIVGAIVGGGLFVLREFL